MKANDAYEQGLKLAPEDAGLKSGLASVKRAIDAEAREGLSIPLPSPSSSQMLT